MLLRRMSIKSASIKSVGFVGLGAMGLPMCENLMAAGYDLKVTDIDKIAVAAAVSKGANRVNTPAEAASGVDAVITMVPNDEVLREVTCNPSTGVLSTLSKGALHVSCSTVHPDTSRHIARLHDAAGSAYVGAPIFARADGVAARLASFVVGGSNAAVDACLPLLEANSNGIFRFGEDPGAGNVVKLCGNCASRATTPTAPPILRALACVSRCPASHLARVLHFCLR